MLRKKILNIILSMSLLLGITSCISNTEVIDGKSYHLAVSVNDLGFTPASGTKTTTRATESGYVTSFAKGDQIGLYVVNSSNTVETANLCLTYDGTNWNYPTGTTLYYDNTANKKYFAYYPYQSTLADVPTTSTATDAATFFATAISDWTPATDQSTQTKYTASDLMVGTGTAGTLYSNATRTMSFSMSHQMALVGMNFPYYYLSTDNNYTYTLGLTCKGFTPYHLSKGNYRYIIKPATNTSIWGYYCPTATSNANQIFNKAFTIAAGTYQTMNVDNTLTSTSYTMSIGDYYLNDGSVIPNATTNKYLLSKAIGVVFDTSTSTTDQGYGWKHGYVMALAEASPSTGCQWSANDNDEVLTNYSDYSIFIKNKDGYTETQTMKNNSHDIFNKTNYPAFWYALNYNIITPSVCSGWYLPSIGQWYDICVNLGGMPVTVTGSGSSWCRWYGGDQTGNNYNYAVNCANSINNYLTNVENVGYAVDKFKYQETGGEIDNSIYHWSSSEFNNIVSLDITITGYNDFNVNLGYYYSYDCKTCDWSVRSVLTF